VPGEGGTNANGRLIVGSQHRITLGSTPPLGLKAAREQARKIIQTATEGRDPRDDRRERNLIRHSNKFTAILKKRNWPWQHIANTHERRFMTNFTKERVDRIVAAAVRHGHDGKIKNDQAPSLLSGMETNLRDVLEWAEKTHDEASEIAKRDNTLFERLKATQQQRASFMSHIGAAIAEWQNMTDQISLIWFGRVSR
jgi:hypothetical protein